MQNEESEKPLRRSSGAIRRRRVPQPWPKDREFRILAIDGGGIKGIFPAAFLAGLEGKYLGGRSVAEYFDLITGTSTGGILALGLASGLSAQQLLELYTSRGGEIFPPGRFYPHSRRLKAALRLKKYVYDRLALERILGEVLGDRKLADATHRLCIPSMDGTYGEVYIFKTPHHPDFTRDGRESMVKVGCATAAAPTYYKPLLDGGYTFVDGGVWANNPTMIGLTDALSCYDVSREQIKILSLSCGDDPYLVTKRQISRGGIWHWRNIISAAMHLQSLNAIGQAGLLIGADRLIRIAPSTTAKIEMDDWIASKSYLPPEAEQLLKDRGDEVAAMFLKHPAELFKIIDGNP